MAAVALVHVLDHLLSTVALDVDVDVGRTVALGRQEPLEQQAERHGIGGRDPERVTDRRVGGAPPALAEDVRAPAELDDVPHDEEVAGEVELLDQGQLVVDRGPRPCPERQVFGVIGPLAVAAAGPVLGDAAEVLHLGQARRAEERGQVRRDERQVERRGPADLCRPLDHPRVATEPAHLFGAGPEVGTGGRGEPRIDLVEAAPRPHRRQGARQLALGRCGVVDVVGRHALHAFPVGELGERIVAGGVERVAVVPELHQHPVAPERLDQPPQLTTGRGRTVGHQRRRDRTLAAAREHPGVTGQRRGHIFEGELRRTLLPGEVADAERPRQSCVPVGPVGDGQQVRAVGVGGVRVGHETGADLGDRVRLRPHHRRSCIGALTIAGRPRWPRPSMSVISVPNTVGRPTALAASAKRTTP